MAADVTQLLQSIEAGNEQAPEELLPLVYGELRKLARARLAAESANQTLQPTELVHEAYIRLVGQSEVDWNGRGHFFGAAAEAMRRILIDRARKRKTQKHGGDRCKVPLEGDEFPEPANDEQFEKLLRLDLAIDALQAYDPGKAELVKLRYFAGLSNREACMALGISPSTGDRYWVFAKAWLQREISQAR